MDRAVALIADIDFETYSEAGLEFRNGKWRSPLGDQPSAKRGLSLVGAWTYSEHPTTEVLSLSYRLPGGWWSLWTPGTAAPLELFAHIAAGGLIRAHSQQFEYSIWRNVCCARMGWPYLRLEQLTDSAAQARAWGLPGGLEKAAKVLTCDTLKDMDGAAAMRRLSVPRNPTKGNAARRLTPASAPDDFAKLYAYNVTDIVVQEEISRRCPPIPEPDVVALDARINTRGIYCDYDLVRACMQIVRTAQTRYTAEITSLTQGAVTKPSEVQKIVAWLHGRGLHLDSLDADEVDAQLAKLQPCVERRVLEIRSAMSSAAVKKLPAMWHQMPADRRIRNLFVYCGAGRTRRWSAYDLQPHNLPSGGPDVCQCVACGTVRWVGRRCCGGPVKPMEWGIEGIEAAIPDLMTGDFDHVTRLWGDALLAVSGCLRGMMRAAPGNELICSDFSSIEAVVLAALAGEQWRLEVFRTHGKLYEMSASKITGIPFEDFLQFRKETGQHRPERKTHGKVSELASGYQGGLGAWKAFGADEFMSDEEIQQNVKAWREASPKIVDLWYGLERAAVGALLEPGTRFAYRGITYLHQGRALYCILPSGGYLTYHNPSLVPDVTPWGKEILKIRFWGWNTNPKNGPVEQWIEFETYGGKLTENVTQAVARDRLAHAMLQLDPHYPIVMHVHDEPVAEVPEGYGSVEDFESLMMRPPAWAADWPIKAAGGWRGGRYRKG